MSRLKSVNNRSLRNPKLRDQLWLYAGGKCQICGCDLDETWEADHIIPWKETHRTNVFEMQALCRKCNREKGIKVASTDNLLEYWSSDRDESGQPKGRLRKGQAEAIHKIRENVDKGKAYTAIILPTRYGKSDVIRLSSYLLKEDGLISTTVALSPNIILRDQLAAKNKVADMRKRYGGIRGFKYQHFSNPVMGSLAINDEHLNSLTTHIVTQRIDSFLQWGEHFMRKHRKPILFFVDECHSVSDVNVWGGVIKRFVDIGALAVLCTATPYRDDQERIVGFDYDEVSEEDIEFKTYESVSSNMVRIDTHSGTRTILRLRADHETSFNEAWNEEPTVIFHMNRVPFDVTVRVAKNMEIEDKMLSVMTENEASKYISQVCRDKNTINEGVKRGIRDLRERKQLAPNSSMLIFGCNDTNGNEKSNHHIKAIEKEIKKQAPDLRIVIATSTFDNDSENNKQHQRTRDVYSSFLSQENYADVLIVKQMAGVGIDCPWIKTLVDLSPNRAVAGYIQKTMRGATPYIGKTDFTLITPDDINGRNCFKNFFVRFGGDVKEDNTEVTHSELKEKKEGGDNVISLLGFGELTDSNFNDTKGNVAAANMQEKVRAFKTIFPDAIVNLTDAEIAIKINEFYNKSDAPQNPITNEDQEDVNTTEETDKLIAEIQEKAKSEVGKLRNKENVPWDVAIKATLRSWASAVGLSGAKLRGRSVEHLRKIKDYAEFVTNDQSRVCWRSIPVKATGSATNRES